MIFAIDELIKLFSLERCSKSGARFDYEKGKWFNHKYLQKKSNEELAELFTPTLAEHHIDEPDKARLARIIGLVKERVSFVKELWDQLSFFYVAPESYDPKAIKKRWKADTPAIMQELIALLEGLDNFESKATEEVVIPWIEKNGYHMGNVMNAFRLAVVGECRGPHRFDITEIIGKEETLRRLRVALEKITPANE